MSLSNNTETASWLEKPPLRTLKSIRLFFTKKTIDLLRDGILFDGAFLSDVGAPMIVPLNFLKPNQTRLVLFPPAAKGRLIAFNPGTSRMFFDPVQVYRGHDVASVNDGSGFRVKGYVELVNEELVREVPYPEALRYIGFPDIYPLIRDRIFTQEERSVFSEGSVHQVTKKGAEKLRLLQREQSNNGSNGFFGGGGSLKSRKWLPV